MCEKIKFNLDKIKKEKGFCVFHLNIRSILPKLDEVKEALLDGSFEVIGVSDTWLNNKVDQLLVHVDGYRLFRQK